MSILFGVVFAVVIGGVLYKIFFTKETWSGTGVSGGGTGVSDGGNGDTGKEEDKFKI